MKRIALPAFRFFPASVLGLILILGCPSNEAHAGVTLPAVGPRPAGEYDTIAQGYLMVFSRTEQTSNGEDTFAYPHSSYRILDSSGRTVKWVENHDSSADEEPQKMALPPGTYTVKAWSDKDGLVTVPVIIKVARTTDVHLENGRAGDASAINSAKAVKTPSGQIVGWKS